MIKKKKKKNLISIIVDVLCVISLCSPPQILGPFSFHHNFRTFLTKKKTRKFCIETHTIIAKCICYCYL